MMTTMQIYTVYDKLGKSSGFLFESTNDETAIRSIRKQIQEDKQDFELYRIGTVDHLHMKVDTYEPVKLNWLDYKEE